jgi:hypothetical protein
MYIKSKSYLFFLLLFIISLSLYGCQDNKFNNNAELTSKTQGGLSLESIISKIKEEKGVFRVEQPGNKEYVIYAKGDEISAQVFIWKVNQDKPIDIGKKIDNMSNISFSPDCQFVLIDSGFDILRECEVVSIKEMKSIGNFSYSTVVSDTYDDAYPLFSPDYKHVIYMKHKFMPEINQTEGFPASYGDTLSIAGFNFISKNEQTFFDGNEKYYFYLEGIDDKGIINITKRYLDNQEVIEKISIDSNKTND